MIAKWDRTVIEPGSNTYDTIGNVPVARNTHVIPVNAVLSHFWANHYPSRSLRPSCSANCVCHFPGLAKALMLPFISFEVHHPKRNFNSCLMSAKKQFSQCAVLLAQGSCLPWPPLIAKANKFFLNYDQIRLAVLGAWDLILCLANFGKYLQ